jgi:hypothetical protein
MGTLASCLAQVALVQRNYGGLLQATTDLRGDITEGRSLAGAEFLKLQRHACARES